MITDRGKGQVVTMDVGPVTGHVYPNGIVRLEWNVEPDVDGFTDWRPTQEELLELIGDLAVLRRRARIHRQEEAPDMTGGALERIRELEAENARLRAALERAYGHLRFNRWVGDSGSDRRYVAVQEIRAAMTSGDAA